MKKTVVIVSFLAMSLAFSLAAFAQTPAEPDNSTAVKTEKTAIKSCPINKKMKEHFMPGMMMGHMMSKQMVATSDGGVIVLAGDKIMKYDRNLKLVKEAEIKIDIEGMDKGMMGKKCYRMNKEAQEESQELPDAQSMPSDSPESAQK